MTSYQHEYSRLNRLLYIKSRCSLLIAELYWLMERYYPMYHLGCLSITIVLNEMEIVDFTVIGGCIGVRIVEQ